MVKTIKVPLYFHTLKINVTPQLKRPEFAAYVVFEGDRMILHIKPNCTPGIIAHEAVHMANYIFKQCYIQPDLDNDEPQAYLVGWLVNEINRVVTQSHT